MAKRDIKTTSTYLRNAPLPEQTETYTVISHGDVMDKTKDCLNKKGLKIINEEYRCTQGGQVAQGIYHIKYDNDADLGLLFTWRNSYDKTKKFSCNIGGYVTTSLSSIIKSEFGSWNRLHTGTALEEMHKTIEEQIDNADSIFKNIIADKEAMKLMNITENQISNFIGESYIYKDLMTSTQLSLIKSEIKKPSYFYNGDEGSLWHFYNAILVGINKSHPKNWLEQHSILHYLICSTFNVVPLIQEEPEQDDLLNENENDIVENAIEETTEEVTEEVTESVIDTDIDTNIDTDIKTSEEVVEIEFDNSSELVFNEEGEFLLPTDDIEELVVEDDFSWPCSSCGDIQGPDDVYYDGQLCSKCYQEQNS